MSSSFAPTDLKALLKQRGFSPPKAEVWAEFVHQVVILYWQATNQLLDPENWAQFKQKLGALGKPKPDRTGTMIQIPIEDAITSEIGHRADQLRKALPSGHFLRRHEVQFYFEKLVPSEERAGRYSKKVDFMAVSQYDDAPEIAIEAKPITNQADIKAKYLGAGGIGCFFTGDSPYTKGPLGAMFAYSINPEGRCMQAHVLAALREYQPPPIHIHRVSLPRIGSVDCSSHDRACWKLEPISILHLERNFPPDLQQAD